MWTIPDCPTAISEPEIRLLQHYARGRRVVECGALLGFSTIKLAEVASHVVSIDLHEGYSGSTLRGFMNNLWRSGLRHKVTPIVGDFRDHLATVPEQELAFIDLTGTFIDTFRALHLTSANLVAVHDFGRPFCAGVEAAINCAKFRIIEKADTLVVAARF